VYLLLSVHVILFILCFVESLKEGKFLLKMGQDDKIRNTLMDYQQEKLKRKQGKKGKKTRVERCVPVEYTYFAQVVFMYVHLLRIQPQCSAASHTAHITRLRVTE